MERYEAVRIVEKLLRDDPEVAEMIQALRARGRTLEDIARMALRAQKRIEAEVQ